MAATQGFAGNDTELWVYQETSSGLSAAMGWDSVNSSFNFSVLNTTGAFPSDLPVIQMYPSGDIVFIPGGVFSLIGDMTGTNDITLISTTASSSANSFIFEKSRSGGVIVTGDTLGSLLFKGHDGTDYITASQIRSVNSGTVATNRIASNLLFYTHPDSTTASTLRMTIAPTGEVTIATPDSGTGLTVSGGGITATAGAITATSGDITATAGNINLTSSSFSIVLPATSGSQIKIASNTLLRNLGGSAYGAEYQSLFFGYNSGNASVNTHCSSNVGIGARSLESATGCQENFAMGYRTLGALTGNDNSGYRNVAIGNYALYQLVGGNGVPDNGSYNTCIGYGAGNLYTGNEYSNILINYAGVAGQNNRLQIGTSTGTGTGNGKIGTAFICGIYNIAVGATAGVVLADSSNQIGSISGSANTVLVGGTKPSFTGSPSVSGSITAGTGLTATTGGLTVSAGSTTLTPLAAARAGFVRSSTLGVLSALIDSNTDGQVLISSSSTTPAWASLSAGTNITITPGSNTITIATTATPFAWTEVTGTSQSMAVNNGYILNNAGLVTATLPTTAAVGDLISLVGKGAGGWLLAQNASQLIHFSSATTTTGAGGSLASTNQYDCVDIICTVANTTWTVRHAVGNLTIV